MSENRKKNDHHTAFRENMTILNVGTILLALSCVFAVYSGYHLAAAALGIAVVVCIARLHYDTQAKGSKSIQEPKE